jgi:hypothetical protein
VFASIRTIVHNSCNFLLHVLGTCLTNTLSHAYLELIMGLELPQCGLTRTHSESCIQIAARASTVSICPVFPSDYETKNMLGTSTGGSHL